MEYQTLSANSSGSLSCRSCTIISHTQKHRSYRRHHHLPQEVAGPFAKKADSISGETRKTLRKEMQLQLQNSDTSQGRDPLT